MTLIASKYKMIVVGMIMVIFSLSIPGFAVQNDLLVLQVGESEKVYIANADNQAIDKAEVLYKSLSEQIATVSKNGVVTGISPGKTSIEVQVMKNGKVENGHFDIEVESDFKSLDITEKSTSIPIGEVYDIDYTLVRNLGVPVESSDLNWSVNDPSIAGVDENGQVYPYGLGPVKVTAKTRDGVFEDSVTLIIRDVEGEERLRINNSFAEVLKVGEFFLPDVRYVNSRTRAVNFEILNLTPEIVEVREDNTIKALSAGEGKLIYIDKDRVAAGKLSVNVYSTVAGITLKDEIITFNNIGVKDEVDYELISDEKSEIYETGITWTSTDEGVATVSDGVITTHGYGVAEITARTIDGGHQDNAWVYVREIANPTPEIEYEAISIIDVDTPTYVGKEQYLEISTIPSYESLDGFQVSVSQGPSSQIEQREDGFYFTPSEAGRMVLYARTPDGHVAQARVYVRTMLQGVEIADDMITVVKEGEKALYVGQEVPLKADIETAGHLTMDEVEWLDLEWSSSNPTIVEVRGDKLIAHKLGETTLQVKTRDGSFSDNIEIGVYPMSVGFTVPDKVNVNTNETFKPEGDFRMIYRFEEPIIDTFDIEQTGVYFTDDYVKSQIAYYEERKEAIEVQRRGEPYILRDIRVYNEQIAVYESILELSSGGYCKISDANAKDLFDQFKFAKIGDGVITGLREGRIDIKVESRDSELEKPMSLYVAPGEAFGFRIISSESNVLFERLQ